MVYSIPHLHTIGNHYETGYTIGKEFKDRIHTFINEFKEFHTQILPFIQTKHGKKVLDNYLNLIESKYPWYVDEMKGIAEGSGTQFQWVVAINLRVELMHITNKSDCVFSDRPEDTGKECSDFFLIDEENNCLIHNEDSVPSVYNTCYIVTCKITPTEYNGKMSPEENFTCYCYAAHLPGNAFGFNSSGFCFGVNAIYPKLLVLDAFPRQIINRIMMSAKNLEELENVFLKNPIAYGVGMNVGYFEDELDSLKTSWNSEYFNTSKEKLTPAFNLSWNYELVPNPNHNKDNIVSKHCIISPKTFNMVCNNDAYYSKQFYYHFNHYERYKTEECINISSRRRKIRADQIRSPTNLKELIDIASDSGDSNYPIFRTPREDDPCELKTIATALFDLNKKTLSIFVSRPSDTYKPMIEILMKNKAN